MRYARLHVCHLACSAFGLTWCALPRFCAWLMGVPIGGKK